MAGEKILVVEDEPLIARMLVDRLAELYVEVVTAGNGVEALELAWQHTPDLILLDVMMPQMDGFEVARILKENPKTSDIPIVFLTALDQVKDKVRGLQLGAEDYITKPFHWDEVLTRIRRILDRSAEREDRRAQDKMGVQGRLRDMSLPSLIQFLELEQKTGILTLSRGARRGHIYFDHGKITNAVLGPARGESAVYRLLAWAEGDFALEPVAGQPPPEVTVTQSNHTLILEGMRRRDEGQRLRQDLPPDGVPLKVSPRLQEILAGKRLAADPERFLGLLDGKRDIEEIVAESGLDDLKALENLSRLWARGMVERA